MDVLLVMDVQQGIVDRYPDPGYLERVSQAAAAARVAGIRVVYVTVGFRRGHPEISPRNRTFSASATSGLFDEDSPARQIHPAVAPLPQDLVVTKRRVSAFTGSDLDGLVVLSDACLDPDPEVHRVLTEKVFPRQAEVLTVAEWAAQLSDPTGTE